MDKLEAVISLLKSGRQDLLVQMMKKYQEAVKEEKKEKDSTEDKES